MNPRILKPRPMLAALLSLGLLAPAAAPAEAGFLKDVLGRGRDRNAAPAAEPAGEAKEAPKAAPEAPARPAKPSAAKKAVKAPAGPAVEHRTEKIELPDRAVTVHVVEFDPASAELRADVVLSADRFGSLKKLSTIAKEKGAVAAVNGAFFNFKSRHPVGYLILDGKPVQAPLALKERTTFGIMKDGTPMIGRPKFRRRIKPEREYFSVIDGINKPCGNFEIVIFNYEYGDKAEVPEGGRGFALDENGKVVSLHEGGPAPIPADGGLLVVGQRYMKNFQKTVAGDTIQLTQTLMFPWENIDSGFGSIVLLLEDGKDAFDPKFENIPSYLMGRAARTAVGITAEGRMILLATNGKGDSASGLTFQETGRALKDLGCVSGVALDGGGSTTMWYEGKVVNDLHGAEERAVANAVVIVPRD